MQTTAIGNVASANYVVRQIAVDEEVSDPHQSHIVVVIQEGNAAALML